MAQTDLHIHSSLTAGGELSPRALAERCCEERLTLAALTDRRAVSGVPECIWRGAQLGVRILPGIELDCRRYAQDFLVLGLGISLLRESTGCSSQAAADSSAKTSRRTGSVR